MSSFPAVGLKYSFRWAQSVVKKVEKAFPRATKQYCEFTGMTTRSLALELARGSPEWRQAKRLIHLLGKGRTDAMAAILIGQAKK